MKTAEEIFEDARLCDDIPNYHNVIEINCFMSLRISTTASSLIKAVITTMI